MTCLDAHEMHEIDSPPGDAHEVLCRAVQRISKQGWHQSNYFARTLSYYERHARDGSSSYDQQSALCLSAACMGDDLAIPEDDSPRDLAVDALARVIGSDGQPNSTPLNELAVWNDDPDRTLDEVLDVLGAAIAAEHREMGA